MEEGGEREEERKRVTGSFYQYCDDELHCNEITGYERKREKK